MALLSDELSMRVFATVRPWIMALPKSILRRIAGQPIQLDGEPLDLHTQFFLRMLQAGGQPDFADQEPAAARAWMDAASPAMGGIDAGPVTTEQLSVAGAGGDIPVVLATPGQGPVRGAVVFLHGGGWVVGSPTSHLDPVREIAARTSMVVASVDYRLAPEHRFPAGLEDAEAVYRWMRTRCQERAEWRDLPVVVAGDSAGGNLSAALCLKLRDSGQPLPDAQVLIYPATDLVEDSESRDRFAKGFLLTKRSMDWFQGHYLADSSMAADPLVSPLCAGDLAGLPPAVVTTAGFDPLRDEGKAYARRLGEAGVSVRYLHEPTLIHGYLGMGAISPAAAQAVERTCEALDLILSGNPD